MHNFYLEFNGVSCKGCVTAIETKLSSLDQISKVDMDKSTGNSVIRSELDRTDLDKKIHSFAGCCDNCQINLKTIDQLENENTGRVHTNDENLLIKKQYKQALERLIAKEEVACNEYCVCKTTTINRFEEFADAPSFSSIFNLLKYLEEFHILKPGLEIVDFGCGTGHDSFQIAPVIFPGHILGLDVTDEMVEFASQTALKLNIPNVSFKQAESLQIIPDQSKDLLLVNNVFNILIHKNDFVTEANKLLKVDGILVIADEFIIDYLPDELKNDPAFQCGGIAGAMRAVDLKALTEENNFILKLEKSVRKYDISYQSRTYKLESKILVFSKK